MAAPSESFLGGIFAYSKWDAFNVLCGRLHFGHVVTFLLVFPYAPWWFIHPGAVVTPIWQKAEAGVTERFGNTPLTEALAKFERYSAQQARSGPCA